MTRPAAPRYPCRRCRATLVHRDDLPGYWVHVDTGVRQCGDGVEVGEPDIPTRYAGPRTRRRWDLREDR